VPQRPPTKIAVELSGNPNNVRVEFFSLGYHGGRSGPATYSKKEVMDWIKDWFDIEDPGKLLESLRKGGWQVGAHYDYCGEKGFRTYWLFTHLRGACVQGDGETDLAALKICINQIAQRYARNP
jgi:hypothetical protein